MSKSTADKVMGVLYTLPHEILPGRAPRWTESCIRRAVETVESNA